MVVTAVVIGAGSRGRYYSHYATQHPNKLKIVGVAEPKTHVRDIFGDKHSIPKTRRFSTWEELANLPKFADAAFITTPDQLHIGPAVTLAKNGYHLLLEKPMAVTVEDCKTIYETCKANGVMCAVGHVLRYHPGVQKIKELIETGAIGEVVNINHTENVGFWHFAHSFVRGNWRRQDQSTFSLLSKCCHDVDLLCLWMAGKKCRKVSSFGSLHHFRKENKPKDSGSSCFKCPIEPNCPYSAKKIYLVCPWVARWPASVVCDIEGPQYEEELMKAVEFGPYGKCVYETDNDVCDNQVCTFQFDGGATATLTMIAFSEKVSGRTSRVYGTKGELFWEEGMNHVKHYDFLAKMTMLHDCKQDEDIAEMGPHGSCDYILIRNLVEAINKCDTKLILTEPRISLRSHLLTFAAEHSRVSGSVVEIQDEEDNFQFACI